MISTSHGRTLQPNNSRTNQSSQSTIPSKKVTLSTSTRNLNQSSLNTTQQRGGAGGTNTSINSTKLNLTQTTNSNNLQPIPSQLLHPNHITDVFPDALSALTKTEEHTYSSSHNPATNGTHGGYDHHAHGQQNGNGASITHAHAYTMANAHSHHKIPLRMPIGPNVSQAHLNGTTVIQSGNIFDPANQSGMEDSYVNNGQVNITSATPNLAQALSTDRVAPLQRENLRLVRSNNALQAHLVAEGERIEECERNWAQEMRNIKSKHADLQFLHAQKTRKLATQEQQLAALQSRLEAVLSDRQAYVKESIEAPSRLSSGPIQPSSAFRATERMHESQIEQLRAHELKITQLQGDLDASMQRESKFDEERKVLEQKVKTRDEEIKRLAEVLESERNWDKMHVEFELKKHIKTETKLQSQIDFLNGQRESWERDIQAFKEMGVSSSYIQQLQQAQAQTRQLEGEYQQAVNRLQQLQNQVEEQREVIQKFEQASTGVNAQAQEMLQERDQQIAELSRKYENLSRENDQRSITIDRLSTQLESTKQKLPSIDVPLLQENFKREEQARLALREQYTKLVKENDELSQRFNQTVNELSLLKESSSRELSTLQSDLLRAQYLNEDFQRRLKDLSEHKANLSEESGALKNKVELTERMKEGLGGERDYYKQQNHELNGMIHTLKLDLQQRSDEITLLQRNIQTLETQLKESIQDRSKLISEHQTDSSHMRQLENTIADLKSDLQAAKHQNANLNDIVSERQSILNNVADMNVTQRGLVRQNEKLQTQIMALSKEKENLFDRLSSMTQERDTLLQTVASTDNTLIGIQEEVLKLQQEREEKEDAYARLYDDYNDVSKQLNDCKQTKLPLVQSQLQQQKSENEKLQAQIHSLQENTVSKLTHTEREQRSEILNLKSAYSDLQRKYEQEMEHSQEAFNKITQLEHELHLLQTQSQTKQSQIQSSQSMLTHHTDLITKLNLQISDLKAVCRSLETQKNKVESEWKHVLSDFQNLQEEMKQQIDLHTNQSILVQQRGQEIIELKTNMNALAEQKAQLELDLHEAQLRIASLSHDLSSRGEMVQQTQSLLEENSSHQSLLQDTLRAKEYELTELLNQLQTVQREKSKLHEEVTLKNADLKAILNDLENVIKENQVLTRELSAMKNTIDTRSTDAERLSTRLTHTEEQYRAKEMELLDLLSNYRIVCLENDRLKAAGDELESERANFRTTMKQQQDALFKQDTQIRASESELRKRMVDIQSLEHTIQELSRALEQSKKVQDTLVHEKNETLHKLESARSLAGGMESSRSEHLRILQECKSQLQKTQQDLSAIQLDNTHLINTLQQQKEHSANLEKVIATLRGQSALQASEQHSNLHEKNARMGQLQQELQHYKIQLDTLQEQIQTLNEYREKQNGEINRLLQSPSGGDLSASGGISPSRTTSADHLRLQIKSLQGTIDAQFAKIQDLQNERAKLKSYIVKYEAKLRTWEQQAGHEQSVSQGVNQSPSSVQMNMSSQSVMTSFIVERA